MCDPDRHPLFVCFTSLVWYNYTYAPVIVGRDYGFDSLGSFFEQQFEALEEVRIPWMQVDPL